MSKGLTARLTKLSKFQQRHAASGRSFEELLDEVQRFGLLKFMHQYQPGDWQAKLRVNTDHPGVTAEIVSGDKHATPSAALEAILKKIAQGEK